MNGNLETCFACDDPTGRAGAGDDSLFCSRCGRGPYCEGCHVDHERRHCPQRSPRRQISMHRRPRFEPGATVRLRDAHGLVPRLARLRGKAVRVVAVEEEGHRIGVLRPHRRRWWNGVLVWLPATRFEPVTR